MIVVCIGVKFTLYILDMFIKKQMSVPIGLARVACSSIIDVLWLEEIPAIIRDVVRGLDSF